MSHEHSLLWLFVTFTWCKTGWSSSDVSTCIWSSQQHCKLRYELNNNLPGAYAYIQCMWELCDAPGPPECEMERGGWGFTRVNITLLSPKNPRCPLSSLLLPILSPLYLSVCALHPLFISPDKALPAAEFVFPTAPALSCAGMPCARRGILRVSGQWWIRILKYWGEKVQTLKFDITGECACVYTARANLGPAR